MAAWWQKSDFTFEPNATFSWQHDARFRSRTRISLFDDACCASSSSPPEGEARGLILQLDFHNMTAKADRTYYHDPALYVQVKEMFRNYQMEINSLDGDRNRIFLNIGVLVIIKKILR
ncbi:arylsulfotransferase family protein [Bacillus stercoris]|nr:arylsulfotransferase family protein [Bacillus stercoris]